MCQAQKQQGSYVSHGVSERNICVLPYICVRLCTGLDSPGFNTRYRGDCCAAAARPVRSFSLAQRKSEVRGPNETKRALPAAAA